MFLEELKKVFLPLDREKFMKKWKSLYIEKHPEKVTILKQWINKIEEDDTKLWEFLQMFNPENDSLEEKAAYAFVYLYYLIENVEKQKTLLGLEVIETGNKELTYLLRSVTRILQFSHDDELQNNKRIYNTDICSENIGETVKKIAELLKKEKNILETKKLPDEKQWYRLQLWGFKKYLWGEMLCARKKVWNREECLNLFEKLKNYLQTVDRQKNSILEDSANDQLKGVIKEFEDILSEQYEMMLNTAKTLVPMLFDNIQWLLKEIVDLARSVSEGGRLEKWYQDVYAQEKKNEGSLMNELCDKMFLFFIYINNKKGVDNGFFCFYDGEETIDESACVNAILAEKYFNTDRKEEAIVYAKEGLNLSLPKARQNVFNILGICSIDAGKKYWQLAYDTYFSWIQCCMVGELSETKINWQKNDENEWRECDEGKRSTAIMLNNFAFLCATISDTYSKQSDLNFWKMFQNYAEELMRTAIKYDKSDPQFYCTYGTILSEKAKYEQSEEASREYYRQSEEAYKKYYEQVESIVDKVSAARMIWQTIREKIFSEVVVKSGVKEHIEKQDKKRCEEHTKKVCTEQYEEFFKESDEEFEKVFEYLKIFENDIDNLIDNRGANAAKELENKHSIEHILNLHSCLQGNDKAKIVEQLLLLIDEAVTEIQSLLQKQDYITLPINMRKDKSGGIEKVVTNKEVEEEMVAYYTTLDTARYLFAELYQPDPYKAPSEEEKGEAKNCLTMMHAMYMNDPNEGLTFLQALENYIDKDVGKNELFEGMSAVRFREGIYDKNYIFLKAFTSRIDQLDMWAMYASDRKSGSDSNGCCICLRPETFDRAMEMQEKVSEKNISISDLKVQDDYHLYRVVYLAEDGEIYEDKNSQLKGLVKDKVMCCFQMLKELMKVLNQSLDEVVGYEESDRGDMLNLVREFLKSSFNKVAFLFKEESYFLEEELRLIITRSHDQKDLIRKLDTNPPKLCINPFFQVYVDKLVLGPKVKNMDEWIPYFQYELNNMRKDGFPEQVVVRKSKIHYRD